MKVRISDKYMNDRVYAYVDGSYFIRGCSHLLDLNIRSDFPPLRLFNLAKELVHLGAKAPFVHSDWRRSYWFGSYSGSDEEYIDAKRRLRDLDFDPHVFKKEKKGKEKQVDTQLVTMMLSDSFKKLFDVAVVYSGDLDYLNAVKEVRRNGQDVVIAAFSESSSTELIYEADVFIDMAEVYKSNQEDHEIKGISEMIIRDVNEKSRFSKTSNS